MKNKRRISIITLVIVILIVFVIPYVISTNLPKTKMLNPDISVDPTEEEIAYKTITDNGFGNELSIVMKNNTNMLIKLENIYRIMIIYYILISTILGVVVVVRVSRNNTNKE
jgi:hypothetical protein